jgi:pimeloyl-ACP methyl ester carboxylesterase
MEPASVTASIDGLTIAALDWGGDGPPLLLQHPTGFPAGMFDPLARALAGEYRVLAVDARGHGGSDAPDDLSACTFVNAARDVLAVLDALEVTEVVALGESMGGGVVALVDSLRPAIVRRALFCEAIAFELAPPGPSSPGLMAERARKRRAVWPDRATVLESYASRPPLDVMEPAALAAYVQYGFVDRDDGTVELACAPDVEARWFDAAAEPDGAALAFAHLARMHATVTVMSGLASNLGVRMFAEQALRLDAPHHQVDGTHFFVQEDTARAADAVRQHLSW